METKYVRVPFDVEMAKKITNGEVKGRVVTRDGRSVRILCFDRKGESPIVTLVLVDGEKEGFHPYTLDGRLKPEKEDRFDLMLEIPEYMKYKDGDVVVTGDIIVVIRNPKIDDLNGFCFKLYVAYNLKEKSLFYCADFINQENVRFATEEEKQIFVERLKASKQPKDKEYLKLFFGIEVNPEYVFKTFDKVLVRDGDRGKWKADFFSHKIEDNSFPYICVSESHKYCIPYNDQTKHLLGTTDNWEE